MKVAVIHYHARPGGVTRVVERAVEALAGRAHCLFFTGEAARGDTPLQRQIRTVPRLGYSTGKPLQTPELMKQASGAFGCAPDVWHIHNHSLGKNPALTQEVTNLAMAGQKLLLQIHDFSEDGRPDNYLNLGPLKKRLYPVAPHIHYAVLNQRDARFLKAAGVPEETLHLLPNTVSPLPESRFPLPESRTPNPEPRTPNPESRTPNPEPRTPNPEPRTQNPEPRTQNPEPRTQNPEPRTPNPEPRTQNPEPRTQNPEPRTQNLHPLYVYPCRAIRRKNIGELLLWSARMPHARFAVTLAPKNPEAKPVYDAWTAFANELRLNVEFDAGASVPFEEMVGRADALITTSIAEGFGLAFLEPWMAGKPLTGRNLPEITGDFAAHGLDLSALYTRLPVPLSSKAWDLTDLFPRTLEKALRASLDAYGRPWSDTRMKDVEAALIQNGCVDFGILDEAMQRTVIRAVQKDPDLLGMDLGDSSAALENNRKTAETAYSPQAYGDHLFSIYEKLIQAKAGTVSYADSEKLLDEFLQPSRINLLRSSLHAPA